MSVKEHLKALSIGKGADAGGGEHPTALQPVSDLSPANLNFRFSPLSGFEWKESGRNESVVSGVLSPPRGMMSALSPAF